MQLDVRKATWFLNTVSDLVDFTQTIHDNFNKKQQVDVIYPNFKKVFDTANHVTKKLFNIGAETFILKQLVCYESDRTQYVSDMKIGSAPYAITSEVPLSSIRFSINGITNLVINSQCLLYANDFKLFLPIQTLQDSLCLQEDLANLSDSCCDNKLYFNGPGCFMSFNRKTKVVDFKYNINGVELNRENLKKDLGAVMDPKLEFREPMHKVRHSSFMVFGF